MVTLLEVVQSWVSSCATSSFKRTAVHHHRIVHLKPEMHACMWNNLHLNAIVPWILRHLKGWDPIRLGFLPRSHSLVSKGNNVNRDTFQRKLCQIQTQVQRFSLFLKNCTFSVLTYTEFGEIDVANVCTSQIGLPRWTYKPNMFQY